MKSLFKVAWEDPEEPDKGFKYLYLTSEDYHKISQLKSVHTILIEDEGEQRYETFSQIQSILQKQKKMVCSDVICIGI